MNHGEERAELRGAVYRGDAGSLVGILKREAWPENALQLIGDGLLGVLHAPPKGIDEAAHRCVTALWDRGWEGDADLAAGLEAAVGSGPVPLLRPLPVDLRSLRPLTSGCRRPPRHGQCRRTKQPDLALSCSFPPADTPS